MNLTIGKAINQLRQQHGLRMIDLAEILNISPHMLTKITRDERELSFLMVLRLLKRFDLAIDEFASMLSEKELNRTDLSTIRYFEKEELNRARNIKLKAIDKQDVETMPGKDLTALVMSHIQEKMK